MTELGLMIEGQEGLTWTRWSGLLDAAEELGFASLHRSDHLTGIEGDAQRDSLSLWPSLAVAALRTRRIRFGPPVSPMTFLPPALVAKMAMDVEQLLHRCGPVPGDVGHPGRTLRGVRS